MTFPAPAAPTARFQPPVPAGTPAKNGATNGRIPQADGPSSAPTRIPQVDGPSSSSSSGSQSPPPATYAPRGAAHPSLPQPVSRVDHDDGDEAINSDLDDSDSDGERDDGVSGGNESDIVFCTYDKVFPFPIVAFVVVGLICDRIRWRGLRTNGNVSSKTV